jgi:hypothetical protein
MPPPAGPAPVPTKAAARLKLTATSSAQVEPGGTVRFSLAFELLLSERTTAENTIAWRGPDGTLRFGDYTRITATPGSNVFQGLSFRVGNAAPGATFSVYGVVRINGVVYRTQVPVIVTVSSPAAAPAPSPPGTVMPPPPPVATPPAPPVPPAVAALDRLQWHATTSTTVPSGGTVTFALSFVLLNVDQADLEIAVAWRVAGGEWTVGKFAPFRAVRGVNTVSATFTVGNARPGTEFRVRAAIRLGGTTTNTPAASVTVR